MPPLGTGDGARSARCADDLRSAPDVRPAQREYETLTDGDAEIRARHILARIDKEDEA